MEIIAVRGEAGEIDLPGLTPYVERVHDASVREAVRRAHRGGSRIISLVGEVATGKKRTAWQAIQYREDAQRMPLLQDWHVWPGTSPSDPVTLLAEIARMPPKTVYWLAGAGRYFLEEGPEIGNDVAFALREMIGDPTRGPNFVVCTFTPSVWRELTAVPASGDVDQFRQVRLLLAETQIAVPDTFTEAEVEKAVEMGDPRLGDAAARAVGRRVVQYLVAAPWLDAAFDAASPGARAILRCCIAVRRLGHDRWISQTLLQRGAVGFLSEPEQEALDDGWFVLALEELTRRGAGGASLLTERASSGQSGDDRGRWYRLDDDLVRRRVKNPPLAEEADEHLWSVLAASASSKSLIALAKECRRRRLLFQANQFYRRAADENVRGAAEALIDLFRESKRIDDAIAVCDELIEAGRSDVRLSAAEMLIAAGRRSEAMARLEPIANSNDQARVLAAMALVDDKKPASAVDRYRELAEDGVLEAAETAADMMTDDTLEGGLWNGHSEQRYEPALKWLTRLLDEKKLDTRSKIVEFMIMRDKGRIGNAIDWLHARGQGGDYAAYLYGARLLVEHDRAEDALSWCDTAVEYDVDGARAATAMIYAQAGFLDAAFKHAQAAAVENPAVLADIADLFARKGLVQRALEGYRRAADLGYVAAWAQAAVAAAGVGWVDSARDFFKRAERAGAGSPGLRQRVAVAMGRSGKGKEAVEWYLAEVDPADPEVLNPISDFLLKDEPFHAAAEQYARRVHVSKGEALSWVAERLLEVGFRELEVQQSHLINSGSNLLPKFNDKIVMAVDYWLPAAAIAGYQPAWLRTVDVLLSLGRFDSAERRLKDAERRDGIRSEVHSAIILAYSHKKYADTAVALVESQLECSNTAAVARTATALLTHEHARADVAERLLIRGRDAGDLESRVALADFWARHGQFAKALDEYFVALARGCDVYLKIVRTLSMARNDAALAEFQKYGVTPEGTLAKPWIAAPSRGSRDASRSR